MAPAMLEGVAINLIYADNDFIIRYMNPAAVETLQSIEQVLPIKVADIIGSSIDVFHKNPSHQHRMLARPETFPKGSRFKIGDEWLELTASPVHDSAVAIRALRLLNSLASRSTSTW